RGRQSEAPQPIATSHAGNGEGNGKGSGNSREKSRDDAVVRLEGRGPSGDGVAGRSLRDYAAQDCDPRRLRVGTDRTGGVRERKAPHAADARPLCQEESPANEVPP